METCTTNQNFESKRKLYYTTSEVAALLKVNESTLRFWEKDFPFTQPQKSPKGTRRYTQKEIRNIQLVQYLLKDRKLTIDGAKLLLKEKKDELEKKHEMVLKLRHIKTEIQSLRKAFDQHLNITGDDADGMAN